jgi:hypothetical protein
VRERPLLIAVITFIAVLIITGFLQSVLLGEAGCSDGSMSLSTGTQGACSWHGGVARWPSILLLVRYVFSLFVAYRVFSKLDLMPPKS